MKGSVLRILRSLVPFVSSLVFVVCWPNFSVPERRRLDEFTDEDVLEWPWQTWIVAILVVLICGGGQLCCCFHCIRAGLERGDFQSVGGGVYSPLSKEELALHAFKPDHQKIGHVLRREMRFMLLFPIIPLLAINQTTCEKGMPWWGYFLYLPLLVRAKWIEVRILLALNEDLRSIFLTPGFWLGSLEHADWFTDGALPVQAYLCGPNVTEHFAEAFELSWAWPLAPIVRTLHFWGLLTLVLSFSALAQQLLGAVDSGDHRLDLAADVPGFGAVANWYEEQDHDWNKAHEDGACPGCYISERTLLTSISKIFLENVVQLWLQASFFALIFDRLHPHGKVKLLISMALGLISCLAKILPQAVGLCCALVSKNIGWAQGLAILMGQLTAIVGVAWTSMKLYQSFHCESHIWNLTTGCVPQEIIERNS